MTDIHDDIIMGMHHIGKYGLAYNKEQRTLKFGNEWFVLSTPGSEAPNLRLIVIGLKEAVNNQ